MEYVVLSLLIGFIALATNNQKKVERLEKEVEDLKSKLHSIRL
jgi:uncharacterized membrane-anchored protein YhcB (DUF1043 family)